MTTTDIVLAIIFVVFLAVCFIYVNRVKAKERSLGIRGSEMNSESAIAAAYDSKKEQ